MQEHLIKNLDKLNWTYLSSNPSAIKIVELYPHKINWNYLSLNPAAEHLLRKNISKINWSLASRNPSLIDFKFLFKWILILRDTNTKIA
jgi:hypothetical protein